MSDALASQGTTLHISGASGIAVELTSVTLANPFMLTKTAHGLSNGDVVTMSDFTGADAAAVNTKAFVVKYATANTFCIDLDASALTITVGTGKATPLAWAAVGEVVDWDGPGGAAGVIDVTHLTSAAKEKRMGIPDEGQFTFSMNKIFGDTGQDACWEARRLQLEKSFKMTYTDNTTQTFAGYVLQFSTSGGVDDKVSGSITVEITGAVVVA